MDGPFKAADYLDQRTRKEREKRSEKSQWLDRFFLQWNRIETDGTLFQFVRKQSRNGRTDSLLSLLAMIT